MRRSHCLPVAPAVALRLLGLWRRGQASSDHTTSRSTTSSGTATETVTPARRAGDTICRSSRLLATLDTTLLQFPEIVDTRWLARWEGAGFCEGWLDERAGAIPAASNAARCSQRPPANRPCY